MEICKLSFSKLENIGKSYLFNQNKINSFEKFEIQLNQFLNSGAYIYNNNFINTKHLITTLNNIKIEIYSNEHPPPHFHVKTNNYRASLSIEDCSILENSGFSKKVIKNIQDWFKHSKIDLIRVWNETRPSDCAVGKIRI